MKKILACFRCIFQIGKQYQMTLILSMYLMWCVICGFGISHFEHDTIVLALVMPAILYFFFFGWYRLFVLCRLRLLLQIYALRKIAILHCSGLSAFQSYTFAYMVLQKIMKQELDEIDEVRPPLIFLRLMERDCFCMLYSDYLTLLTEYNKAMTKVSDHWRSDISSKHGELKNIRYQYHCKLDTLDEQRSQLLASLPKFIHIRYNRCTESDIRIIKTRDIDYLNRISRMFRHMKPR